MVLHDFNPNLGGQLVFWQVGKTIRIGGWVKTGREAGGGQFAFVHINDGTAFESIQVSFLMSQNALVTISSYKSYGQPWICRAVQHSLYSNFLRLQCSQSSAEDDQFCYDHAGGFVKRSSREGALFNEARFAHWDVSSH